MTTPAREIIKRFFAVEESGGDASSDPFAGCLTRLRSAALASSDERVKTLHAAGTQGLPVARAFDGLKELVNLFPDEGRHAVVWDIIHAAALAAERVALAGTDASKAACSRVVAVLYRQFVPAVLRCDECASHWNGVLARSAPLEAAALFAMTVDARNGVNALLGKPEVPVDDARELCRWAA